MEKTTIFGFEKSLQVQPLSETIRTNLGGRVTRLVALKSHH